MPVLVNPTLMKNEMADAKLNLTMRVLGDIIQVSKQNEKSKEEQIHQKEFPISVHIWIFKQFYNKQTQCLS